MGSTKDLGSISPLTSAVPSLMDFAGEVAEFFPGESLDQVLARLPRANEEYNFSWLPDVNRIAWVNGTIRALLSIPYRLWKWGTRRTFPRTVWTLPIRGVIRATRAAAILIGNLRRFQTEEELLAQYRSGPIKAYALSLGRFAYGCDRGGWVRDALTQHLPRDAVLRILDFGSGVAAFSLELAAAGHHVTLLDVEGPLSQFAVWRFRRRGLPVEFLTHDAPLLPATYDVVLCLDVLEHLLRPTEAMRRITETLGPGGLLFLGTPEEWGHGYGHIARAKVDWEQGGGDQLLKDYFILKDEIMRYLRFYRRR